MCDKSNLCRAAKTVIREMLITLDDSLVLGSVRRLLLLVFVKYVNVIRVEINIRISMVGKEHKTTSKLYSCVLSLVYNLAYACFICC